MPPKRNIRHGYRVPLFQIVDGAPRSTVKNQKITPSFTHYSKQCLQCNITLVFVMLLVIRCPMTHNQHAHSLAQFPALLLGNWDFSPEIGYLILLTNTPKQHKLWLQCLVEYKYLDIVVEWKVLYTHSINGSPFKVSSWKVDTLKKGFVVLICRAFSFVVGF